MEVFLDIYWDCGSGFRAGWSVWREKSVFMRLEIVHGPENRSSAMYGWRVI